MSLLEPVLDLLQLPFSECVSHKSETGESLWAPLGTTCLGGCLDYLVVLHVSPNALVFCYSVDIYYHSLHYQLQTSDDDVSC